MVQNTVIAGTGEVITFNFSQFDLENTWDHVRFFDGPSVFSPEITTAVEVEGMPPVMTTFTNEERQGFTGNSLQNRSVVSTGNILTVVFQSDFAGNMFEVYNATITCAPGFTDTGNQTIMTYAERNARPVLSDIQKKDVAQEAIPK